MLVTMARLNRQDPTGTTSIRRSFARDLKRRFDALVSIIIKAIVEQDCFGLNVPNHFLVQGLMTTPGVRAFNFERNTDKVRAFMKWLGKQEDAGILETSFALQPGEAVETAWTNTYIRSAYQKGISDARKVLLKSSNRRNPRSFRAVNERLSIDMIFNTPFHADRAGLLFTRAFSELQGITNAMDKIISTVLTQGLIDGKGPREVARQLVKVVTGRGKDISLTTTAGRFIPAKVRAEMLARTEIIRAHHVATIQEYRNYGVQGVKVKAEWQTAEDDRVCEECEGLEGKIYDLDEIEGMIPLHPNCRCVALPVDVTD